jgi:hypothetical protein
MSTNRERAERVLPLIAAYAAEHYWGTEELDAVLSDLVSDVLHVANLAEEVLEELPDHVRYLDDDAARVRPETVIDRALESVRHEFQFGPDEETD